MKNSRLHELFKKYGTDKADHLYALLYEELMESRCSQPTTLLEIGVKEGNSLRAWKCYFPNSKIYGIDLVMPEDSEGFEVFVGDQADEVFLKEVAEKIGPMDIVIDDGGHKMKEQQTSFRVLWPYVSPGGLYAIEDLRSSFVRPRTNNPMGLITTVNWLTELARNLGKVRKGIGPMLHFAARICVVEKPRQPELMWRKEWI